MPEQTATLPTYFWVMTVKVVQTRTTATDVLSTLKGTVVPVPGDTRQSLFTTVREYVTGQLKSNGHPGAHDVLFYSLEPNAL